MRKLLATPLASAVLGGAVTAGILLGAGVVDGGDTRVVYQQSPLATAQPAGAGASDGQALTARDIYKRDAPGVVFIRARSIAPVQSPFDPFGDQDTQSTGSGFVLDRQGHILTNAHVVDDATAVSVEFGDEKTAEAKIVGKDDSTDLALLKVDPDGLKLRPLELGDSSKVQVGDPTVAIGNPFGFDRTLTTGVVSALQRRITAPDGYAIENVIQTDAAINPGNSGGPLIDASGRVIGINSQIATGGTGNGSVGIGFAVPINTAKDVVEQLKASGRVQRPWLGLEYVAIDERLDDLGVEEDKGLLVQRVVSGGPAEKAGIRGGDSLVTLNTNEQLVLGGEVIKRIDGVEVADQEDVARALEDAEPGQKVDVELVDDGRRRTVEVTLGNRPPGRTDTQAAP